VNDQAKAPDVAWRRHPQLTEKMVVDLVNGIEVVNDQLRCSALGQPLFCRLWRLLTGRELRQQDLFNLNVASGLAVVATWLQDLQGFQAESDFAIAAVTSKLAETRQILGQDFATLKKTLGVALANTNGRIDRHEQRFNMNDAHWGAERELKEMVQCLRNVTACRSEPFLASVFRAIDHLWWGCFGIYCRMALDVSETCREIEIASFDVGDYAARSYRLDASELLPVEDFLEPLAELSDEDRLILGFMASPRTSYPMPLLSAIVRATSGDLDFVGGDPRLALVFSPMSLSRRLFYESRQNTEK
jgi:hypothetical protein